MSRVLSGKNPGRVLSNSRVGDRRAKAARPLAFCTFLLVLLTFSAVAARADGAPACPTGNLLAGRRPVAWVETKREMGVLTDEAVVPEGSAWDAGPAMILDNAGSSVTFDLGEPTIVTAMVVQADANDSYAVWASVDGNTYTEVGRVGVAPQHGLRTRALDLTGGDGALPAGGRGQRRRVLLALRGCGLLSEAQSVSAPDAGGGRACGRRDQALVGVG